MDIYFYDFSLEREGYSECEQNSTIQVLKLLSLSMYFRLDWNHETNDWVKSISLE
jgi:hypothetical protein